MQLYGEEHATELSAPYWAGLRDRRLMLQHCRACNGWQHYPRYRCSRCSSTDLEWSAASGSGTVLAATSMDRTTRSEFKAMLPMPLGLIRLEEQVFVLARLVGGAVARSEVRFDTDETISSGLLTWCTA
jgi:uncharacterized OB-fold protein